MKKLLGTAAALLAVSALAVTASAENIFVTISDGTGLKVTQEKVDVQDTDGDGAITVIDALTAAHDKFYDGGAEAGFATFESDYGTSLGKLWGIENGGSYGYYINGKAAFSMTDALSDGDYLDAFAYSDLTAWSDMYCYFNERILKSDDGADMTLIGAGFDENWNPIDVPIAGAVITVNGEKTDIVTDENGKFHIAPNHDGTYVLSAVSDTQTLVPPAAVLIAQGVNEIPVAVDDTPAQDVSAQTVTAAADANGKGSPDTGIEDAAVPAGIALIALGAIAVLRRGK